MSESPDELYSRNHQRYIGHSGSRNLALRVLVSGELQQEILLRHVWTYQANRVVSNVVVADGCPLAGTEVQIVETMGELPLGVTIRVPGSNRVFSLGAPFDAFVFGSEFSYEDFRFFLPPSTGRSWDRAGWCVHYPGFYVTHFFEVPNPIPARIEWCEAENTGPIRVVSGSEFKEFEGVLMPTVIQARRPATSQESHMILLNVGID